MPPKKQITPSNIVAMTKPSSLSDFLGIPLVNISTATRNLKEFSEKYPNETTFYEESSSVIFASEDLTFTLRSDIDEDDIDVYQTLVEEHGPTQIVFNSEYYDSITSAMNALKTGLAKL